MGEETKTEGSDSVGSTCTGRDEGMLLMKGDPVLREAVGELAEEGERDLLRGLTVGRSEEEEGEGPFEIEEVLGAEESIVLILFLEEDGNER